MTDTPQTNGGVPLSGTEMLTLFGANYSSLIPNLEVHCTVDPQTLLFKEQ